MLYYDYFEELKGQTVILGPYCPSTLRDQPAVASRSPCPPTLVQVPQLQKCSPSGSKHGQLSSLWSLWSRWKHDNLAVELEAWSRSRPLWALLGGTSTGCCCCTGLSRLLGQWFCARSQSCKCTAKTKWWRHVGFFLSLKLPSAAVFYELDALLPFTPLHSHIHLSHLCKYYKYVYIVFMSLFGSRVASYMSQATCQLLF